jgi:hypothetical protein
MSVIDNLVSGTVLGYVLEGKKVRPARTQAEVNHMWERGRRRIARTEITERICVSTVFLVLDHGCPGSGEDPILFETLVLGLNEDEDGERYTTYQEAEVGHDRWVEKVKAMIKPLDLVERP